MISKEDLRKLGNLDRELIENRVLDFLDYRRKGNVDALLAYAAPNVVWISHGAWTPTAPASPVVGITALSEVVRRINVKYENLGSTVHEMLIDGDRVCVHRTTTIRDRGGSQTFKFDVIDFLRFRDGLIVEISEYLDAAAAGALNDLN